jgi:hypothetical protein
MQRCCLGISLQLISQQLPKIRLRFFVMNSSVEMRVVIHDYQIGQVNASESLTIVNEI